MQRVLQDYDTLEATRRTRRNVLRCGKVDNESRAQWHARWAHAFGVRQPCWRFRCLLPCGRRSTASPTQSGSIAPALQGHVPYTPPQTAHKAGITTFPQRRETSSWADARKPGIMQKILLIWISPLRRKELQDGTHCFGTWHFTQSAVEPPR